jgi:hypothetical protein
VSVHRSRAVDDRHALLEILDFDLPTTGVDARADRMKRMRLIRIILAGLSLRLAAKLAKAAAPELNER